MTWILICPICSCVIDSFQGAQESQQPLPLHDLSRRSCRRARRHDRDHLHGQPVDSPDRLSRSRDPPAEDYLLRYASAPEGLIPDGTPFAKVKEKLTRAVAYLEPDKTIQIEVEAEAGALYGFSIDGDAGFLLPIDPALPASEQRVAIRCDENSCQLDGVTFPSGKLTLDITEQR
jgi:hypothetical protein